MGVVIFTMSKEISLLIKDTDKFELSDIWNEFQRNIFYISDVLNHRLINYSICVLYHSDWFS